jgi:hypothetical protein
MAFGHAGASPTSRVCNELFRQFMCSWPLLCCSEVAVEAEGSDNAAADDGESDGDSDAARARGSRSRKRRRSPDAAHALRMPLLPAARKVDDLHPIPCWKLIPARRLCTMTSCTLTKLYKHKMIDYLCSTLDKHMQAGNQAIVSESVTDMQEVDMQMDRRCTATDIQQLCTT